MLSIKASYLLRIPQQLTKAENLAIKIAQIPDNPLTNSEAKK